VVVKGADPHFVPVMTLRYGSRLSTLWIYENALVWILVFGYKGRESKPTRVPIVEANFIVLDLKICCKRRQMQMVHQIPVGFQQLHHLLKLLDKITILKYCMCNFFATRQY